MDKEIYGMEQLDILFEDTKNEQKKKIASNAIINYTAWLMKMTGTTVKMQFEALTKMGSQVGRGTIDALKKCYQFLTGWTKFFSKNKKNINIQGDQLQEFDTSYKNPFGTDSVPKMYKKFLHVETTVKPHNKTKELDIHKDLTYFNKDAKKHIHNIEDDNSGVKTEGILDAVGGTIGGAVTSGKTVLLVIELFIIYKIFGFIAKIFGFIIGIFSGVGAIMSYFLPILPQVVVISLSVFIIYSCIMYMINLSKYENKKKAMDSVDYQNYKDTYKQYASSVRSDPNSTTNAKMSVNETMKQFPGIESYGQEDLNTL